MSVGVQTPVLNLIDSYDSAGWSSTVNELLPSIHEVDKNATRIWFAFFPLDLFLALQQAENPEKLAAELLLEGNYYLKNQIDSSHKFLYGHRFWPQVKSAVASSAEGGAASGSLAALILAISAQVAKLANVEPSLTVGITAVALMTLLQVGLKEFRASPGRIHIDERLVRRSPEQILRDRAKDDGQGLLGFLKTINKTWTVVFNENDSSAKYKAFNLQEIASGAAAEDKQKWRAKDPRCIDGPIPVQCRSAACGTCWIGILGGAEKLSDVARLESNSVKRFGYIETDEQKPLVRLACQAQTTGAVSIVIPPWNGVFGKYLKKQKEGLGEQDGGVC